MKKLLLFAVFALLLVGNASAISFWEWIVGVNPYNYVSVISNTDQCLIDCATEYNVTAHDDPIPIGELAFNFKTKASDDLQASIPELREYHIYISDLMTVHYRCDNSTSYDCSFTSDNGTYEQKTCYQVQDYDCPQEKEYYRELQEADVIQPYDSAKIKITGRKAPFASVDNVMEVEIAGEKHNLTKYDWWNSLWAKGMDINLTGKVGVNATIMIPLNSTFTVGFNYSDFAPNGADVRVTLGSDCLTNGTTEIPHAFRYFNLNGISYLFYTLPLGNNETHQCIYYNNSAAADDSDWNSAFNKCSENWADTSGINSSKFQDCTGVAVNASGFLKANQAADRNQGCYFNISTCGNLSANVSFNWGFQSDNAATYNLFFYAASGFTSDPQSNANWDVFRELQIAAGARFSRDNVESTIGSIVGRPANSQWNFTVNISGNAQSAFVNSSRSPSNIANATFTPRTLASVKWTGDNGGTMQWDDIAVYAFPTPSFIVSGNVQNFTSQINFTLSAVDFFEGGSILNFTVNISNSTGPPIIYQSNTTSGLVRTGFNNTQILNITFSSPGFYNTSYLNYSTANNLVGNLTNLRARLNITAVDNRTSSAIGSFNITMTSFNSSDSVTNGTTAGSLIMRGLWNQTYNVTISASGYITTSAAYKFSLNYSTLSFSLNPVNAILINVSDEQTQLPITQNLTLVLTSLIYSNTYTFANGSFFLSNLSSDTYRLDFSNENYTRRTYYVTVNNSFSFLQVWLLANSSSQLTEFITKDASSQDLLPNVAYTFLRLMGSNYVAVAQKTTDISGTISVYLQPLIVYRLLITAAGYNTKLIDLEIDQSQYTVFLVQNQSINFTNFQGDVVYNINPSSSVIPPSNFSNFTLTASSPSGSLIFFGAESTLNGTHYFTNVTGSPAGGSATLFLNTTNFVDQTIIVNFFIKTSGGFTQFNQSYYIYGFNNSLSNTSLNELLGGSVNQLNPFYRFLIAIIVSLVVGAGFFFLVGAMGASAIAWLVFLGFGISGFISWIFPTITGILIVFGYIVTGGPDGT